MDQIADIPTNGTLKACNLLSDAQQHREFVVLGVLLVGFAIAGSMANLANIVVFSNRRMRQSPINHYFVALGACDLCVLVSSILMLSFPSIALYAKEPQFITSSRYIVKHVYAIALIAQTASVWIMVVMAMYRCTGVCRPFFAQRVLTASRVRLSILAVILFAMFYNASRFLELDLIECRLDAAVHNATAWEIIGTTIRTERVYQIIYHGVLYTGVMFALPFLILIVVNCKTIAAVRHAQRSFGANKNRGGQPTCIVNGTTTNSSLSSKTYNRMDSLLTISKRSGASTTVLQQSQSPQNSQRERSTTLMLITLVFAFLICNVLPFLTNVIEALINYQAISGLEHILYELVDISNLLVVVNSSLNILIYLKFSKQYRGLLWSLLRGSSCRQPTKAASSQSLMVSANTTANY